MRAQSGTARGEPADFVSDLEARGLLYQVTSPDLAGLLRRETVSAYIGFDPTAASLHIGSLLPVMTLVRFQRAGHRPIAMLGGGTGIVGDPSGKQSERPMLSHDVAAANLRGIRKQLERFLDFGGGPGGALLVDNAEWLGSLGLLDFLRDVGKHFSVNAMLALESVRRRLDSQSGISYTEFSYSLLQAYDYLTMFDRVGCKLQMGGSDQWGNIVAGCDLIRRLRDGAVTYGLTFPLVTRADGQKFGKSEGGNIWLDPELTTPYAFYQFWLNCDDADVVRYLKTFTLLPLDAIGQLEAGVQDAPERREAQRVLADGVTRLVHGPEALARAQRITGVFFGGTEWAALSPAELEEAIAGVPSVALARGDLGTPAAGLAIVLATGLDLARGRVRTIISSGGVEVNGRRIRDAAHVLDAGDLLHDRFIVVRHGKKTFLVVRLEPPSRA